MPWNPFGAVKFAGSATATADRLIASGLTGEQAAVMIGHPGWMTLAFAIGVFGGCGQCAVAAAQDASDAGPSRLSGGICRLVVGDAVHRVFAAMGAPQVIILTKVVVIAAALFAISRHTAATV